VSTKHPLAISFFAGRKSTLHNLKKIQQGFVKTLVTDFKAANSSLKNIGFVGGSEWFFNVLFVKVCVWGVGQFNIITLITDSLGLVGI
jgi:hypothetical protein